MNAVRRPLPHQRGSSPRSRRCAVPRRSISPAPHLVDELAGAAALRMHQHLGVGMRARAPRSAVSGRMPLCTWHSPIHTSTFAVRAHAAHVRAEEEVGQEENALALPGSRRSRRARCRWCSSSRARPSPRPWCSRSPPRCSRGTRAFHFRTSSAVIVAASEQPAARSGSSTRFCGDRIAAVSAMKCTPQKTITVRVGLRRLARQPERVAHEIGDVLHLGALVVVREHDGVAAPAPAGGSRPAARRSRSGAIRRVGSMTGERQGHAVCLAWARRRDSRPGGDRPGSRGDRGPPAVMSRATSSWLVGAPGAGRRVAAPAASRPALRVGAGSPRCAATPTSARHDLAHLLPDRLARGVGAGRRRRRHWSRSAPAARSTGRPRRACARHRTGRPGRRTPGPRAASWTRAGWRRARRCRPPRPRPRGPARLVWPSRSVLDAAHRVVEGRRHRQQVARRVEPVAREHRVMPGNCGREIARPRARRARRRRRRRPRPPRAPPRRAGPARRADRRRARSDGRSRSTSTAPAPRTASEMSGAGFTPGQLERGGMELEELEIAELGAGLDVRGPSRRRWRPSGLVVTA